MASDHQTTVWVKVSALDYANSPSRGKSPRKVNHFDSMDSTSGQKYDWILASIVNKNDGANHENNEHGKLTIMIQDESCPRYHGNEIEISSKLFKSGDIVMANFDTLSSTDDLPPHDLIQLTHLHEPAVVHCLKKRYEVNCIYTATGPILLSVNPFKKCFDLFNKAAIRRYRTAGKTSSRNSLPPHIFAVADSAYQSMIRGLELQSDDIRQMGRYDTVKVSQSILVSGESGAGKTVSTKHIMRYLANVSQSNGSSDINMGHSTDSLLQLTDKSWNNIDQKILQSNPILESFGNARTIRNDNSSRFGKFIELQFKQKQNRNAYLVGAKIETYLLEKVRLVNQAQGERNYHIFYEMLEGIESSEEQQIFFLEDMSMDDFRITSMSGTFDRRDQVEDYETYDEMRHAMNTMGFKNEEQIEILRITSAILHASNLTFDTLSADECKINQSNKSLIPFLALMGLSEKKVNDTLCYVHVHARGETYKRKLSKQQAIKALEALMKATYGALFNHIVDHVNKEIAVSQTEKRETPNGKRRSRLMKTSDGNETCTIGVLDIFGFESFAKNSFEQLCINYCNEALQQQFNKFVFSNTQQQYKKEGIEWSFIEYPDNQDVLELIDKTTTGIIPLLDDLCRAPRSSDEIFAEHIYDRVKKHPRFLADDLQKGKNTFGIFHYAGPVEYETVGFLEKNKDELPKETSDLLLSSSSAFVKKLAQTMIPSSSVNGRKKKVTVGSQFISQLRSLRERIDLTNPHYVRCLKPNNELQSGLFDEVMIANQLRHAGVLEAVQVSRAGYSQHYTHTQFLQRYKVLSSKSLNKGNAKENCELLLLSLVPMILTYKLPCETSNESAEIDKVKGGLQLGKTKVFLRSQAFEKLEVLRQRKIIVSAVTIQSLLRTYIARAEFLKSLRASIIIQSFTRQIAAKKVILQLRKLSSSITIQKNFRMVRSRRRFLASRSIACWVQRIHRGAIARKSFDNLNKLHHAIIIQKNWRMSTKRRSFLKLRRFVLIIQCAVRVYHSCLKVKKLKSDARNLEKVVEERNHLKNENKRLIEELERMKVQMNSLGHSNGKRDIKERKIPRPKKTIEKDLVTPIRKVRDSIPRERRKHQSGSVSLSGSMSISSQTQKRRSSTKSTKKASGTVQFSDRSVKSLNDIKGYSGYKKRKNIRVGKSKVLRVNTRKDDQITMDNSSVSGILSLTSLRKNKGDKKQAQIDETLLANMLSMIESRTNENSPNRSELEKLRAETEQLKASFKRLKTKVKAQKHQDAQVPNMHVRAPAMSCNLGPMLGGLFGKPDSYSSDETDVTKDSKKKNPWWF